MIDEKEIDVLAKKIWDYHLMHQTLKKADVIFGLGTYDTRIAEWSADLFLKGYAPLVIFSGGIAHTGDLLDPRWNRPEAEVFAEIAERLGVPKGKMILETEAHNTGENILFTRKLLEEKGIVPKSFLLVQKPYMQRRTYAAFKKLWPGIDFTVTSYPDSYETFPNEKISKENLINVMVGDLQRIKEYPKKGFAIEQEIPADIWDAYEKLVGLGYTKHLIT